MRRHGLIGAFLCLLAIWVQVLAPVAASALDRIDPLGGAVICSHAATSDDGAPQAPAPIHHHCVLCQAWIGGGLTPERPAFTALDYAAASPLRWRIVETSAKLPCGQRPGQPRGPPVRV